MAQKIVSFLEISSKIRQIWNPTFLFEPPIPEPLAFYSENLGTPPRNSLKKFGIPFKKGGAHNVSN